MRWVSRTLLQGLGLGLYLWDTMVPIIGFRALIMANQMEKKMENEMEAGII